MAEPIRIRAQLQGSGALVRVLINHPMETGLRHDAAGALVPAWHVTEVTVTLNGREVLSAHWGTAIAKNPLTQFSLKGVRAGDRIAVAWVDNRGERRRDEVTVA